MKPLALTMQGASPHAASGAWGACRTRRGCYSPGLQAAERGAQGQVKAEAVGVRDGDGFPHQPGWREAFQTKAPLEKPQLGCSPGASPKFPLQRQPML